MISRQQIILGRGWLAGLLAALLLAAFTISIGLVPIRADNDAWWHVKTGWYIAEHGLPEHDVFSYTAAEHEWHNHEWLSQLLMWKVFEGGEATGIGGWRAVTLAKSLVLAACYLVLLIIARRISGSWWIALLVAVLAVDASRRTFYPRPPVVSNLLLAGELFLLIGTREKWWSRWWLAILPPAFALWTNLHGAWMAGLVVLAAFVGDDVFRWLAVRFERGGKGQRIGKLLRHFADQPTVPIPFWAALVPLCFLGTLLNPFGYELYKLPARVMSDAALANSIGELMPPAWMYFPLLKITLALTGAVLLFLIIRSFYKRTLLVPINPAEWVLYLFFLYQGINHVRHLLLFGILMVPLTARLFYAAIDEFSDTVQSKCHVVVLALSITAAAFALWNWPEGQSYPARNEMYFALEEGYVRENFPARVSDFVELAEIPGRMFNENHYAGYLIWRFSPDQYKVFSDSRFDIFGGEIWREEVIVANAMTPPPDTGLPNWEEVLDRWNVNWLLVKAEIELVKEISDGDDWVLVADYSRLRSPLTWQVWIRNTEANADAIERAKQLFRTETGIALP